MKRNIFCNRKKGVTMKGKFIPLPPYSELLAKELERKSNKRDKKLAKTLENNNAE